MVVKMKVKIRYSLILSIILTIIMLIPDLMTNSRYYFSIDMESDIPIGFMVFEINAANEDTFNINKAEEISAKYQLSNFDSQNNINQVDVKYYVKVLNENNTGDLAINISVNGLEYKTGKGYGEINLPYDGETKETEDMDLKITCPANYEGATTLNYKVKIIAKGISNENINAEKTAELHINIVEPNNTPKEPQNTNNTLNLTPNSSLQNIQPLNTKSLNIESIDKKILETNETTNTVNNSVANNDVNTNSSSVQNTNQTKSDNSSITNTTAESSNQTTTNSVSNEVTIDKENIKTEDKNQTKSDNTSITNTTIENNTNQTNTNSIKNETSNNKENTKTEDNSQTKANNTSAINSAVENNQTNTKSSNNKVENN